MTPTELPIFEAQWWPVQLETVPGSGEALTIAIVVRGPKGHASVRQVIAPATVASMFGSAGKGLMLMVGTTVLDIRRQLDAQISVEQLELPFGALHFGQMRDCVARDLDEAFEVALRLSSAFAVSQFGAVPHRADQEARAALEEWAEKVRAEVTTAADLDKLRNAFNVPFQMGHKKKARVGFVYRDFVAQFGVLRPGAGIGADVRALKVKIFDLQVLRRERALAFARAELIVGYQDPGDAYSSRQREALAESWEFIADEARVRGISPVRYASAREAAMHLQQIAA